MQTYKVRVELKNSEPLFARSAQISAEASFAQLHAVIRDIFGWPDSHVYIFHLPGHKMKVTNDEMAIGVHQDYLENEEKITNALLALGTPFAKQQLENLRTAVYSPDQVQIGSCLQVGDEIDYVYDCGDTWEISILVEKLVQAGAE
ncbi:MAG: hypothetical protein QM372_06130 [Bacillota bacterium]|jgi:hypothetical protein|nr:hypothetical protein [Bacillota bacterium]